LNPIAAYYSGPSAGGVSQADCTDDRHFGPLDGRDAILALGDRPSHNGAFPSFLRGIKSCNRVQERSGAPAYIDFRGPRGTRQLRREVESGVPRNSPPTGCRGRAIHRPFVRSRSVSYAHIQETRHDRYRTAADRCKRNGSCQPNGLKLFRCIRVLRPIIAILWTQESYGDRNFRLLGGWPHGFSHPTLRA